MHPTGLESFLLQRGHEMRDTAVPIEGKEQPMRLPEPWVEKTRSGDQRLFAIAKSKLLALIQKSSPGDSLPTYHEMAAKLGCSVAPIKQAMRQLENEGYLTLGRGRAARVSWRNSFSRSAKFKGKNTVTQAVELAYRPLTSVEAELATEHDFTENQPCIVCVRLRLIDETPVALQAVYINPLFFQYPADFFKQHDVVTGSLSAVYSRLGLRPLRVNAVLQTGLADEHERHWMKLDETAPVLRSRQYTLVERNGYPVTFEFMQASYTSAIEYEVERLPRWQAL